MSWGFVWGLVIGACLGFLIAGIAAAGRDDESEYIELEEEVDDDELEENEEGDDE